MALVSDAITTCQKVYLNDSAGTTYTSARLLEFMKEAYLQLQLELQVAGDKRFDQVTSALIAVPAYPNAGYDSLTLPASFLRPIKLWERKSGSTDDPSPMEERNWDVVTQRTNQLRFWTWRNGQINFLGALEAREVRLDYVASLTAITAVGNTIAIEQGEVFMAPWAAGMVAQLIMNNPSRAQQCFSIAQEMLDKIKRLRVGKRQATPVRSKRYTGFRQTAW